MINPTLQELQDSVLEDIRCHNQNGVSLNPYSTVGSRRSWQHGFENITKSILDYPIPYLRGQIAAEFTKNISATGNEE